MGVKILILPGGKLPTRATDGSRGHDAYLRAIVCKSGTMEDEAPYMRKTLFDFHRMPDDPRIAQRIVPTQGGFAYRIGPGETALCGLGFVSEMKPPLQYVLHPRSGLQSVHEISLVNAHTIVDSDYRGEAGALLKNCSGRVFALTHAMRIAQIVFDDGRIPHIELVDTYETLSQTARAARGFGSTGR